jgi:hypothetical protein
LRLLREQRGAHSDDQHAQYFERAEDGSSATRLGEVEEATVYVHVIVVFERIDPALFTPPFVLARMGTINSTITTITLAIQLLVVELLV